MSMYRITEFQQNCQKNKQKKPPKTELKLVKAEIE